MGKRIVFLISNAILFCLMTLSCNQVKSRHASEPIKHSYADTIVEVPPPPMSCSCSNSMLTRDWFLKIADKKKVENKDIVFVLALFETDSCYSIYLKEAEDSIKFENNYYSLKKEEFQGLGWKERLNEIRNQLKKLVQQDEFKRLKLSKARSITIEFDDAIVLHLK